MSRFFRITTDQRVISTAWEGACAGPTLSTCWLIGGGPSLSSLPCQDIANSPAPKLAINLSGSRLIRPTFWTAYDPTIRFHRSLYLDSGIIKFLPRSRAMDLVPETNFKVCECPQTYFFDRDPFRGFSDFLSPQATGIVDWADTLVQSIDILYRLGFRRVLLAGCELFLRPSQEWITRAVQKGVSYEESEPLADFSARCRKAGMNDADFRRYGLGPQYHFDEAKPFDSALQTDAHYLRVVQSLRLCRTALCAAGLQLISVTPRSRLNHFFEYQPAEAVLDRLRCEIGDPDREPTRGLYTQSTERLPMSPEWMKDVLPPRRPATKQPCECGRQATASKSLLPKTVTTELIVEEETWRAVDELPV